ncbi:type I methionyl aminopeptidase [Actinomadura sp. DC4]|uniref:type I methionyl aminopeptidase n=1 Tax=Actinomadura sp. DC4 TaxID=3055069 RepID=UPI0025B1D6F3|nr:type I methionyl aminopeptidase [Actinomadura sp. DC4]MDN3356020.1 type I methionyl aminopeptidase [Actinomadura sp. DC4]
MVTLKNQAELDRMRAAGRVVGITLRRVADAVEPGISLAELDAIGASCIKEHDALPSFLDYHPRSAPTPYPAVLCLSVNDAVVHGIPGERVLKDGDILSIDCGAIVDGYHGDAAVTVPVGRVDDAAERLMKITSEALTAGIAKAVPGGRLGDVSHAVETTARPYGLLDGCGGHGIGTAMHEDPHVANTGRAGRGMRIREGLVIAIEPMLIESGSDEGRTLADGWTIATADGSRAAHFEHTVAVTEDGPKILTEP